MWQVYWLAAGMAWGTTLLLLLWPRPNGTLMGAVAGWYIETQIGRLDSERRKHLEMANIPVERIINWQVGLFLVMAVILFGLFTAALGSPLVGAVLGIGCGAVLGWSVPMWATLGPYRKWQREVSVALPVFVSFLPIYLRAGFTARKAMERATSLTPNPLKGELEQALRMVQLSGRPYAAFDNLVARVGVRELDQIITRIALLWNQAISPDVLQDMRGQLEAVREVGTARTMTAAKSQMIMAAFSLALALMALVGGLGAEYVATHVGVLLG